MSFALYKLESNQIIHFPQRLSDHDVNTVKALIGSYFSDVETYFSSENNDICAHAIGNLFHCPTANHQ